MADKIPTKRLKVVGTFGSYGEDGATYVPHCNPETGELSWSNNKGLPNPETVSIRGPQGERGEVGMSGVWVGSEAPTESGYNVWIDPNGRSTTDFPSSDGNVDVTIDGETLVIAENSTATIENETLIL